MGPTGASRLEFVVRFVRTDFATIRPGDLLNWREDLGAFLGTHPGGPVNMLPDMAAIATAMSPPFPSEYTADDFRALVSPTRRIVVSFLRGKIPNSGPRSLPAVDLAVNLCVISVSGLAFIRLGGSTHDVFLMTLAMLLVHDATAGLLRLCPECGEPFLRNRKQLYCTRRCTNRALKKAARMDSGVKAKEAREARERYAVQVERTHGAPVRRRLEKKRLARRARPTTSGKKGPNG